MLLTCALTPPSESDDRDPVDDAPGEETTTSSPPPVLPTPSKRCMAALRSLKLAPFSAAAAAARSGLLTGDVGFGNGAAGEPSSVCMLLRTFLIFFSIFPREEKDNGEESRELTP